MVHRELAGHPDVCIVVAATWGLMMRLAGLELEVCNRGQIPLWAIRGSPVQLGGGSALALLYDGSLTQTDLRRVLGHLWVNSTCILYIDDYVYIVASHVLFTTSGQVLHAQVPMQVLL